MNYAFKNDAEVVAYAEQVVMKAMPKRIDLTNDAKVRKYLSLHKTLGDVEKFTVMFLDVRGKLIAVEDLFEGSGTRVEVDYRKLVAQVLKYNAHAVIVSHNHPQAEARPSEPDIEM